MKSLTIITKTLLLSVMILIILFLFSCSDHDSKKDRVENNLTENPDSLTAEILYNKALEIFLKTGNPHFGKDSADLKAALILLDSSLQLVPNNRKYIHFKGDILLRLGLIADAIIIYKHEYMSFDSTKNDYSFYLGLLSYHLNEPDYKRYFKNAMCVYDQISEEKSLDSFQKFNIESLYIYSLFFVDSVASINKYIPFRERYMKEAPYLFNFDLRTCNKADLVGYFVFQNTFNGSQPDKKKH
ncbi:MAG TPA: hypothetical protein DHV29_02260 [Bacteroidales bacterium]|nr:MAG: hypothetical protein A2W94_04465 [Bacteroidetes bacterium GWE2_42_42]HCB63002.1 hypothetical protein [Bacteroidales bacterium]HCY22291.1 hypothetical protein [Bacteroidales bacterium]